VVLAMTLFTSVARADSTVQCVQETERAQVVRDEGHLLEARELFRSCAREQCPRVVRRDCMEFLASLEDRIPSVVLAARDEHGRDLTQVRVTMDDRPFATDLGTRAIPIDPGSHVFRFEADDRRPIATTVLVREGEKNRLIEATLEPLRAVTLSPPPAPPPPKAERRRIPTLTWILGGVAVAGGAAFGTLSLLAVDQAKDLERTCAPRCSDDAIEPVETKFLVGRIAGGIGAAAAVSALLFYAFGPVRF
jgi:hypothetical protein